MKFSNSINILFTERISITDNVSKKKKDTEKLITYTPHSSLHHPWGNTILENNKIFENANKQTKNVNTIRDGGAYISI